MMLTRVDPYLEPPPPPTSRLAIPRCGTSKKVSKYLIIDFQPFLTCFFTNIGDFFADFREQCRFSSPSSMWATFRRSGADVEGYKGTRGDP